MKDDEILNNIDNLLKNRKNTNIDTMLLYSLINKNMEDVDKILEIDDEDTVELKAVELKEFLINFKISNEILSEMITNNIDINEVQKINQDYKLTIDLEKINIKKTPPIRTLLGYNNVLDNESHLIDSNLTDFLDFIEKGDADNALFVYEELTSKQKLSIPHEITSWLNQNANYV